MTNQKFVVEKVDDTYGIYLGEITDILYDSDKHILVDRPCPNESCFYNIKKAIWEFEYTCPAPIKKRRINTCNKCEHYTTVRTCKICKCFMPIKTSFSSFNCPVKKW